MTAMDLLNALWTTFSDASFTADHAASAAGCTLRSAQTCLGRLASVGSVRRGPAGTFSVHVPALTSDTYYRLPRAARRRVERRAAA